MGKRGRRADGLGKSASVLDAFTAFRTVAIVGGSPDSYWTREALANLARGRRPPRVFTIHPRGRRVDSLPVARSAAEAPFPPDLALLVIPAAAAARPLAEIAAAGAKAAIVVGDPPADGFDAVCAALHAAAAENHLPLLGPGSLGALSPARDAFPFAGRLLSPPPAGNVAFVTQSGALAVELLRAPLFAGRLGLSHLLCVGAGTSFGLAAALETLADDDDTRAVGIYLEGIDEPARLAAAAERAHAAGKPLVVLRGGRTGAARTRPAPTRPETDLAVGGDEARLAGFLRHHGLAEVPSLEALIESLVLLDGRRPPRGRRVGIVSVSAGAGRLGVDAFAAAGLALPAPALDLTGRAVERPAEGAARVRKFAASDRFDVVVLVSQPPRGSAPSDRRIASWVAALAGGAGDRRLGVPVGLFHGPLPAAAVDPRRKGNPFLAGLREAAAAVAAACAVGEAQRRRTESRPAFREVDVGAVGSWLLGPPRTLSEPASLELLGRYGIAVAPWRLCTTATAAARFARETGGRVAVKAATPDVAGKAAAGLVRLGLEGDTAVRAAFHEVTLRAQRLVRSERLLGATVMGMVEGAARLVVGVVRDERLGMLLVARRADLAGGVPEVSVRACPLRRSQALEVAAEAGLGAAADVAGVAETLVRLGRLGADLGGVLAALTVGPLMVGERGSGCAAVDACAVLRPPPDASTRLPTPAVDRNGPRG